MANFDKPIQNYTEEELLDRTNNWDPRYGIIASYELLRRLAVKNEQSSKKFARGSLLVSLVAIVISLVLGTIQMLNTQDVRIKNVPLPVEIINSNT